jgi:SEC-C motif
MGVTAPNPVSHSPQLAVTLAVPPRIGCNDPCHCGSGRKYKRCGCYEQDESIRRQLRSPGLPPWILCSRGKLHQFEKYACQVFDLPELLAAQSDARRAPDIPTFDVVNSLFHSAVLRIPSLNALEGDLKESDFQKLLGHQPTPEEKPFSADVVANVLDKLHVPGLQKALEQLVHQAERNKVFREGSYGGLRCVAIDGWEPFASYKRHCSHCLVRHLKVKRAEGAVEEIEQYYHRYVIALLLGPTLDVVLGIEPVLNEEARKDTAGEHAGHEGELTAAYRLLHNLHQTYGSFIEAVVVDALYANGPWMSRLEAYGYGGFIVLKKEDNEPLKEALALWQGKKPCDIYDDPESKEHVQYWDEDEIETLDSYQGKIRVIRAVVTKPEQAPSTWCFAIVGERARRVSRRTGLKISRSRWHIENTAFHQWILYWNLGHVFRHTGNATLALVLIWMLAFNLLQLFIYRRLKRPRRPKDPTDTIRHIVEIMLREIATLPEPLPWMARLDSS